MLTVNDPSGTPANRKATIGQVLIPGNMYNGALVQAVNTTSSAVATGTTTIPFDDTIPQNTEGTEFMTLAITPKSTTNILVIMICAQMSYSIVSNLTMALFQDTTANALSAISHTIAGNTYVTPMQLVYTMAAGTTSSTTFKMRAGANGAGTVTFNGTGGTRIFNTIAKSSIVILEYKA